MLICKMLFLEDTSKLQFKRQKTIFLKKKNEIMISTREHQLQVQRAAQNCVLVTRQMFHFLVCSWVWFLMKLGRAEERYAEIF